MTKNCECRVTEDSEELGYEYVMCTKHYDELLLELSKPFVQVVSLVGGND